MRLRYAASAAAAALLVGSMGAAHAAPITLTGNFIQVGISDRGTLGSDGSTEPGLLHDPTGTQNFGVNDYLTPGTPHDGFSVHADQITFRGNDNDTSGGAFGNASPTLLTGAAALGFDHAATWSGTTTGAGGSLSVTNSYFFNNGDERILVHTILTAGDTDLTNLAFARSNDPDPDHNTFGSFDTNNQRGNTLFGPTDFVGAAGPNTGLTLGLLNLSGNTFTHNTEIDGDCCDNIDPYTVLLGGNAGPFGDFGLNLAWMIGKLAAGTSVELDYAYVVGDNIATIGGPSGPPGVPEPATWAMMILGALGAGLALRSRRKGVMVTA